MLKKGERGDDMDKLAVLRQYFGFPAFRAGQQTLIDAVLSGRDALGVMPTGGGKSLCYELPALLLPGMTLVVSPLISLMKDQVMALRNAGIPAGCINSSMSLDELRETYRDARYGAYKLLYVAPERLLTDGFCSLAQELEIPLVAVDEAHCISQWGQDFRPSYLKIVEFLQRLPRRPAVAAFTATATAQVRADIIRILQLHEPETVVTGFDRPNLRFEVLRPKDKRTALLQLLSERRDKSGIVYCATRKTVEQVCGLLQEAGFAATRYHAGLDADERKEIRRRSSATAAPSWPRPTRSAWALTSRTSPMSFITICRKAWRRIIRRRDARGATAPLPTASCCIPPATSRRLNF